MRASSVQTSHRNKQKQNDFCELIYKRLPEADLIISLLQAAARRCCYVSTRRSRPAEDDLHFYDFLKKASTSDF